MISFVTRQDRPAKSAPDSRGVDGHGKFISNSILLVLVEVASKAFGIILFAVVARYLGPKDLGLYGFGIALANFCALAPRYGFEFMVQKEVGRKPELLREYFWEITTVKVLLSLGALGLLWSALLLTGAEDRFILITIAILVCLFSFLEFGNAGFRSVGWPKYEALVRGVFSMLNLALGITVLYAGFGFAGFLSSQILSVGLAIALCMVLIHHIGPVGALSLHWSTLRRHLVAATPFAWLVLALYFSSQVSILLLPAYTTHDEVGYFFAALRVYDNLTLIPAAVMGALLPRMSHLYQASVTSSVRTFRLTVKYLFILSGPLAICIMILAPQLTRLLYSASYDQAAPALQILMIALVFCFWNYAGDIALMARNQERLMLRFAWIVAVVHVIVSWIFIASFSYYGACWAIVVTQIVRTLMLRSALRPHLGDIEGVLLKVAFCLLIMGAVMFTIKGVPFIITGLAALLAYGVALSSTGLLSRRELQVLHR